MRWRFSGYALTKRIRNVKTRNTIYRKGRTVKTFTPKPADLSHEWYIVDATDVVLGRLSSQVATLLRGKNKPTYAPHADSGNHVIVINAAKVALTGNKLG